MTIARQPIDLVDNVDLAPFSATMAFVMLNVAGDGVRRESLKHASISARRLG